VAGERGEAGMSTTANIYEKAGPGLVLPLDQKRGAYAIWLLIATEASLFITLFCVYFLEGNSKNRWEIDQPPKFTLALILLVILVSSSIILHLGERQLKKGRPAVARAAVGATIIFGLGFLALQSFEYLDHWKSLTPYSDTYGSIFYTITTFHAAHVIVGLLLLGFLFFLPRYGATSKAPFRPYHTVSLYWHFVDAVWFFIVAILYLIPNGIVYVH
jgi:heme/copper-type cytochrome/quinol oxidase subunit 3